MWSFLNKWLNQVVKVSLAILTEKNSVLLNSVATRSFWNRTLAAADFFPMFTQSVKFSYTLFSDIKRALSGLRQFLVTQGPSKMTKNAFYFSLKALFVIKIFKLLSWLFGHVEKRLDEKDKVNFKIYDVITWETNNCTTLPNISRSKSNQTMKFGQLTEFNMRNSFLKKSCAISGGETIPRLFSKKSKLGISLDQ